MPRPQIKRMWVNQPSTLQPMHKYHGENVLAVWEDDPEEYVDAWFTHGTVYSVRMPKNALSERWKKEVDPQKDDEYRIIYDATKRVYRSFRNGYEEANQYHKVEIKFLSDGRLDDPEYGDSYIRYQVKPVGRIPPGVVEKGYEQSHKEARP